MKLPAQAPIGVYDSGVGGLSVLRSLRQAMPEEHFLYVADSGCAPYGARSQAFLAARARQVVGLLAARGAKAVVLACNTVSVAAAAEVREAFPQLPIIAMEPAIKPAVRLTRSGTVLVLATAYTAASPQVARLVELFGEEVRVLLQGCPGLVEQVERGDFGGEASLALLRGFVQPHVEAGADTIVLGCTHYAFLVEAIAQVAGAEVTVVDPSPAVARQLAHRLQERRAPRLAEGESPPSIEVMTSGRIGAMQDFLQLVGLEGGRLRTMDLPEPPLAPR